MNSPDATTECVLEHQLKRLNACYAKSLELIREAEATGNEITITERLRPVMHLIQELEEHSVINHKETQATIQSSTNLSSLVNRQKRLLICLLEKVQKIETKLTAKQSEISPARDRERQIQKMRKAYQQ